MCLRTDQYCFVLLQFMCLIFLLYFLTAPFMAKQLAAVHNVVFMYLSPIRDVRIPLKLLMPNLEVKRAIGERFTYLDSILNVLLAGVITYILFPNILVSFVIRISLLGPATVEAVRYLTFNR